MPYYYSRDQTSNFQNVPESPGDLAVFFSLMIVVDSRAVFPHSNVDTSMDYNWVLSDLFLVARSSTSVP